MIVVEPERFPDFFDLTLFAIWLLFWYAIESNLPGPRGR